MKKGNSYASGNYEDIMDVLKFAKRKKMQVKIYTPTVEIGSIVKLGKGEKGTVTLSNDSEINLSDIKSIQALKPL